jgi:hypothetical protein
LKIYEKSDIDQYFENMKVVRNSKDYKHIIEALENVHEARHPFKKSYHKKL